MPTPQRRPGYLLPPRATRFALFGVMLGMFVAVLNQTVVATALPGILADLGGLDRYSWVFTAYLLGLTVSMPAYGALSDRYGRRRFMLIGLALLAVGSLAAAAAGSMSQLIAARAVQGLGAGAIIPLALATIGDLVPAYDRGRWQAVTGVVLGVATVAGPLVGGWAVDHLAWRWAFLFSVPPAAVCLAVLGTALRVPPHPDAGHPIDYRGICLLAGGLAGALLIPLAAGAADAALVALMAAALAGFLVHEARTAHPLIPLTLFRDRLFGASHLAGFLLGTVMFVPVVFVPLLLQGGQGESATQSAVAIIPMMLGTVVASAVSGQLISRGGRYRRVLLAGPLLMAAGFAALAAGGAAALVAGMALAGLGIGALMHNLVLVVQNGIPRRLLGIGTSTTQLARQLGGALGVGAAGVLFDWRLAAELGSRGVDAPSGAGTGAQPVPGPPGLVEDALAAALHPLFLVLVPIAALTLLAVAAIPELPLGDSVRAEPLDPP